MDEVQLANYVAGLDPGPVVAGHVASEFSRILEVRVGGLILISDYTLTKTQFRHPEITFQDYRMLPSILTEGFAVPGNSKRSIEICHIETNSYPFRLWRICLKGTRRHEAYVTMFHRYKLKEARRIYRRAVRRKNLVKDLKNQLARRELRRASDV